MCPQVAHQPERKQEGTLIQALTQTGLVRRARTLSALRHPDYRRYWLGLLFSVGGFQMLQVAQGWLVYDLTGQARFLGLLGLVVALPTLTLSLLSGVVADRVDQRRLILLTQVISAALMGVLATLVLLDVVRIWHVLMIAMLAAAAQTVDTPSRMSLYPHLIERKDLMNAVVLNNLVWQSTRVVGPALAGFLIASTGMASPFYAAGVGFLGMALAMRAIRLTPSPGNREGSVLGNMAEGLRFVRDHGLFAFLIGMTFFNSFFGLSYILLLPVFARDILHVGARGLGFLHGASAVGSLLALLLLVVLRDTRHQGPLLIGGATLFGAFLILFSLSRSYPLSLVLLFLSGASMSLYMMMVQTTLQARVPDHLRGRVMGIYALTWSLLSLGALWAGFVADTISAPFAVAVGGAAVAAFALVVAAFHGDVRRLGTEPAAEAS
jgi:MFS family permease